MTEEQKKLLEGIINNIVQPLEARIVKLETKLGEKPPESDDTNIPPKKAGMFDGMFD